MDIPGYKIERLIGEGGMASVYLAEQQSLGRQVALKILKRFDHPEQAQRFLDEGRILASLNHQNIITIHDIGVVEDQYFIAMEYLQGGSLRERIGSGVTPTAALDILQQIGGCLDFVHRQGIVHRDVKPANILFHVDGAAKLTDFGIAKQLISDQDLTLDGRAFGSPYYLSPEQAQNRPLDGRTDIYALGVVFYEMLVGCKPYAAESHLQTMLAHLRDPIPLLPEEFQPYQELLQRMMAKEPEDRFASAGELVGFVKAMRLYVDGSITGERRYDAALAIKQETAAASAPSHRTSSFSRHLMFDALLLSAAAAVAWFFLQLNAPLSEPSPLAQTSVQDAADKLSQDTPSTGESRDLNVLPSANETEPLTPQADVVGFSDEIDSQGDDALAASLANAAAIDAAASTHAPPEATPPEPSAASVTLDDSLSDGLDASIAPQALLTHSEEPLPEAAEPLSGIVSPVSEDFAPERNLALEGEADARDLSESQTDATSNAALLADAPNADEASLDALESAQERLPAMPAVLGDADEGLSHALLNDPAVASIETADSSSMSPPVEQWMRLGSEALQAYRLTLPAENNALYYYRKVLAVEPEHQAARDGVASVASRYAVLADKALNEDDMEQARRYLDRGFKVQAQHQRLLDLDAQWEGLKREAELAELALQQANQPPPPEPLEIVQPPEREEPPEVILPPLLEWDES
jgi:serine/threonine-protein kinase PpkA